MLYGGLIGVILFTPLEILQVHFGLIEFKSPLFLGIPWWVPLLDGLLFALIALLFPVLEGVLTATFQFKHRYVFLEVLAIILAFVLPALCQDYPNLSVLIFAIYLVFRLGFFHAKWDWFFVLLGVLLIPTVEIFLISLGLYHFTDSSILDLPNWLPLEWGIVCLAGRRVADVIDLEVKRKHPQ